MIDKLRSMAVFARVAEAGSFRRAAERLGLSASVVSHHVTHLEDELGVQLLYRSTRHVAMTDAGRRFFESCSAMLESAEEALGSLNEEEPVGVLRLVAPTSFSSGPFVHDVAEFCQRYPRADVRLEFDDRPRNLIQEGIDLMLCFGPQPSSTLVSRTLFHTRPSIWASPDYLASYTAIDSLELLQDARWIRMGQAEEIELLSPDGQTVRVRPRTRISVNSVKAQHEFALAGLGLVEAPAFSVGDDVAKGRLVQVLPGWSFKPFPCCALFPAKANVNSLARRFFDFLWAKLEEHRVEMAERELSDDPAIPPLPRTP
ncbi:MAG: LysR family transcriptional regulator [Rhodocyclaceae bacterium]